MIIHTIPRPDEGQTFETTAQNTVYRTARKSAVLSGIQAAIYFHSSRIHYNSTGVGICYQGAKNYINSLGLIRFIREPAVRWRIDIEKREKK